jgi:hypothetical protein
MAEHTSAEAAAALTRSFEGYLVPTQMTAQAFERGAAEARPARDAAGSVKDPQLGARFA